VTIISHLCAQTRGRGYQQARSDKRREWSPLFHSRITSCCRAAPIPKINGQKT
jgi:hypothetical protein